MKRTPGPAALLLLLSAACFSSAPPAPPPRLFDCAVVCAALAAPVPPSLPRPRVAAEPDLGAEFALRVGAHELRLDSEHRWVASPDRLVQAALEQALYVDGPFTPADGIGLTVTLRRFEFDLTAGPTAVVELRAVIGRQLRSFTGRAAANAAEPVALAAAMATALSQAVTALRLQLLS